jgi:hypothetical protein
VDVRDVAAAHVLAMTQPNAQVSALLRPAVPAESNVACRQGRYICAPEVLSPMQVAAVLKPEFPTLRYPSSTAPKFGLYLVAPFIGARSLACGLFEAWMGGSSAGPWDHDAGISWTFVHRNIGVPLSFDCSKVQRELGFQFRPIRQGERACGLGKVLPSSRSLTSLLPQL